MPRTTLISGTEPAPGKGTRYGSGRGFRMPRPDICLSQVTPRMVCGRSTSFCSPSTKAMIRVSTMALNAAASRPARASWLSSPATSKGRPDCSGPAPGRVLVYQDPTCIGHLLRQSPRRLFTLAPFPSRHPASWGCRARVRSLSCSSYTPIEPELRRRSGHDGYPLDSG